MMNTDEMLFCVDCAQIAAEAWANGDLELAEKAFAAAVVTIEQCGDFLDLEHQEPGR